jgi:hypothetical protein
MTGAAEIRVAGHPGEMFVADSCTVEGPWLHAEGRWRTRVGANHADLRWSDPTSYTWQSAAVLEIRWAQDATA